MRLLLILAGLLLSLGQAQAQYIRWEGKDYLDTTLVHNSGCDPRFVYYYSVNVKYPKNSATLLQEVRQFLGRSQTAGQSSGYVTFRFGVDCRGQRQRRVQVLQTDAQYRPAQFPPALVQQLYAFFQQLEQWPLGQLRFKTPAGTYAHQPVNYMAFVSFKINNGEVVAVVP